MIKWICARKAAAKSETTSIDMRRARAERRQKQTQLQQQSTAIRCARPAKAVRFSAPTCLCADVPHAPLLQARPAVLVCVRRQVSCRRSQGEQAGRALAGHALHQAGQWRAQPPGSACADGADGLARQGRVQEGERRRAEQRRRAARRVHLPRLRAADWHVRVRLGLGVPEGPLHRAQPHRGQEVGEDHHGRGSSARPPALPARLPARPPAAHTLCAVLRRTQSGAPS